MPTSSSVIRADNNFKFYLRFLLIGIALLGWAAYCIRDGAFHYPELTVRANAFKEIAPEEYLQEMQHAAHEHKEPKWPAEESKKEGWHQEWETLATEKGWPTGPPAPGKTDLDIATQYIMAAGCSLVAIPMLWSVFRSRGRWIETDGTKINTSWGQTVPYDSVTQLDKKKWRNKGIAKVKYQDGGATKKLVIDDFKYMRQETDAILYDLEQNIDPAIIVNGPPEPPIDAAAVETVETQEG